MLGRVEVVIRTQLYDMAFTWLQEEQVVSILLNEIAQLYFHLLVFTAEIYM